MTSRRVEDPDGRTATVVDSNADRLILRLDDGREIECPASSISGNGDDELRAAVSFDSLPETSDRHRDVFLEAEEHLRVERYERETARVRVRRRVETRQQVINEPGWRESVEVSRVPIGKYVSEAAPIRQEDDLTIIPVYEEVLVVERRLLLKEEVHLRKRRESTDERQSHNLRRSVVEVERTEPEDPGASGD